MTLKELVERAHQTACEKGWHLGAATDEQVGAWIALIHSEVSEALEGWLWRQYLLRELNTMRLTPDRKSLEVISVDIDVPDLLLPLPLDIASDWVDQFLAVLERLRTESDV